MPQFQACAKVIQTSGSNWKVIPTFVIFVPALLQLSQMQNPKMSCPLYAVVMAYAEAVPLLITYALAPEP